MDTKSLQATEEVGARGATHPRVKKEDIESNIVGTFFSTGYALLPKGSSEDARAEPLKLLTICMLVLANGFVVIGHSAPASPENFDADKGKEFAYENAFRQIWPLMGFALRERLQENSAKVDTYMRATGQTQNETAKDEKYGRMVPENAATPDNAAGS